MGVERNQQVLQDDCLTVHGPDERDLPRQRQTADRVGVKESVQRVEVALRESDVELLYQGRVLEFWGSLRACLTARVTRW